MADKSAMSNIWFCILNNYNILTCVQHVENSARLGRLTTHTRVKDQRENYGHLSGFHENIFPKSGENFVLSGDFKCCTTTTLIE